MVKCKLYSSKFIVIFLNLSFDHILIILHIYKRNVINIPYKHLHVYISCKRKHNSYNMKLTWVPINRQIIKETAINLQYIYSV